MGQGESAPKVDYLLQKDKLIKQYRGVDINSVSAPSSRVSTPHILPKHSLHRNQKFWDKGDFRAFINTRRDSQTLDSNSPASLVTGHKRNSNRYGSLRVRDKKDLIKQVTDEKTDVGRTKSENVVSGIENRTSSEKIFEEHAEYANELLNAPYVFKTSYASVENVAFKRSSSAGDVSVADSRLGQTSGYTVSDKQHVGLVNQSNSHTLNEPVSSQAHRRNTASVSESETLADPKAGGNIWRTEELTAGKVQRKPEHTTTSGSLLGVNRHFHNSHSLTRHRQSRVDALREKFEIQGKTSSQHLTKKTGVSPSKSGGIPESGGQAFRRRLSTGDLVSANQSNIHKALTRKNAVLVDVGSDLNTETSDCHPRASLTESHDPVQSGSNTESSVFNTHLDGGGQSVTQTAVPSKIEVICGILPPHKITADTGELPGISKVTINSGIKDDIEPRHVQLLKLHQSGDLECVNSVIHETSTQGKTVHSEESSAHRPVRVQSLRKKFEHILLQHQSTQKPQTKPDTTRAVSSHSSHKGDPAFDLHKFPVARSRSDSHIKLEDKENRRVRRDPSYLGRSKEEADVIYDDTLVRNSQIRKSVKGQVKRINIPDRQDRSEASVQKTSHFKKRDVIVSKSIPVEEHLYEEYTVKLPSVEVKDTQKYPQILLPVKKKQHKSKALGKKTQPRTKGSSRQVQHKADTEGLLRKVQHKNTTSLSSKLQQEHSAKQKPQIPPRVKGKHPLQTETSGSSVSEVRQSEHRKSAEILSGNCVLIQHQTESQIGSETKPVVCRHPPQTVAHNKDIRKMKKDSKRHRRKSDSSTSNMSDSSSQQLKSSKKWRKGSSKNKSKKKVLVAEENEDPGLSHNWGSMIHEYQEKYVTDQKGRKSHMPRDLPPPHVNPSGHTEQYNNVRQVFNRGMVLPVKRAPPGLSAQEVESESGATDYSTHSWTAVHRPAAIRAHMDAADYNAGQTYVKERIDDSFSSSVGGGVVHGDHASRRGNRMRMSSQSSQYTSDVPMSPGRQRKVLANDINHQHQYTDKAVHRPVTPESYHHSRTTRYHSDYPSSPEVPRRMRLTRQYVSYNSDGGAMSPTHGRRFRHSSVPREPTYLAYGDNGYLREQSLSRERLEYGGSLQRPVRLQQQRYGKTRSLSTDRLADHAERNRRLNMRSMSTDALEYAAPPQMDHRLRERSISREYVDHHGATLSPTSHRKKLVQFDKKKYKKKKSVDEKAKGFVDTVIDEAMDMFSLSPRNKRKSKSKEKLTSRKNQNQRNVVHTTNIYNEFVEDESPEYDEGKYIDRRAFSDLEDYRSYNHQHQAADDFEQDLRSLREIQQRKPSVLRPQPINGSLSAEKRSCIRPIAGSGITRDGSAPPPKSAYKNYDFELSVGPNQYTADKKKRQNSQHYVSDSEFSTMDIRSRKKSSYPHIKFGPAKAKSQDNLLSDVQKPAVMTNMHVPYQQQIRSAKSLQSGETVTYDSDIEDKKKLNPPTLTRGMVTKILHKLEDDVRKLPSLKAKPKQRQKVEVDTFKNDADTDTSTWPRKDHLQVPQNQQSQIGATLYGTLPPETTAHHSESKPYSTYLPLLNDSTGPLLTSSPVSATNPHPNTPQIEISPFLNQTDPKDQSGSLAHTRFKMFHGDHIKIQPVDEETKSLKMTGEQLVGNRAQGTPKQDSTYGVFSNENMIVADLAGNQGRRTSQTDKYQVRKIGQLYGTQPDISMNKQQTLNFYLFNQVKSQEDESDRLTPQVNYMARNVEYTNMGKKEKQADIFLNEATLPETETELREYLIHHKQTQTPASPKKVSKNKRIQNYNTVQKAASSPPKASKKHIETTYYVTKEREIEKLPPEKQMTESCVQTDEEKQGMVQHCEQADDYVEERCYSPEEEFLSEQVVEQHTTFSTPVKVKEIPIQREKDWNTTFKENLSSEYRQEYLPMMESREMEVTTKMEEKDDDDDDETVILETVEVEEKEQRIAMAIFEEVEFSHQRKEGGKTVSMGGIDGTSEIPIFWEPDCFEGVVDKRKKKMLQVKDTDQKGGDKRSKHSKDSLALEEGVRPLPYRDSEQIAGPKPMSVQEERRVNSSVKPNFDKTVYDDITALDKVLEEELAKTENDVNADDVQNKTFEQEEVIGEDGLNQSHRSYEKTVHVSRGSPEMLPNNNKDTRMYKSYNESLDIDRGSPDIFAGILKSTKVPVYSSGPYEKASKAAIETTLNPYLKRRNFYGPDMKLIGSSTLEGRRPFPESSHRSTDLTERIRQGRRPHRSPRVHKDKQTGNRGSDKLSQDDADNIGLTETSSYHKQSSSYEDSRFSSPAPFKVAPAVSSLQGATVHSEQSEPVCETHFEKDADGNTVKVTEWQHQLTKTVEYPEEQVNQTMNTLPEAGYIHMNLHEGIVTSDRASDEDTDAINEHTRNYADVTEETEVALKPYHFESKESTLKVSDDTDFPKEKRFLYDIKKAKLKPIPKTQSSGWKQTYGTMSTHL